jgi:hypothetical protein
MKKAQQPLGRLSPNRHLGRFQKVGDGDQGAEELLPGLQAKQGL